MVVKLNGSVISYDVTNTDSEHYPGDTGAKVDRFSQWYSYDHDASPAEYIDLINYNMRILCGWSWYVRI